MGRRSHVVVVPYPAQGHVSPLMKFAYKLAENGIKVTFVNADFIHDKIMSALPQNFKHNIPITLVSISTGPAPNHDDTIESIKSIASNMPCNLQKLIENINRDNNDEHVSCVVADITAWWAIEVAERLGIKRAAVVPFGVGNLALSLHASKLIESGIIDVHGTPFKDELIYLSKETPPWNSKELLWSMPNETLAGKFVFRHFTLKTIETVKSSDWILVNSFYELEQSDYDLIPDALPIGPLIMRDDYGPFPGNFWQEDSSCLNWLDQQPQGSVIYAAFGSTAVCNQQQIDELAYGFELIGQPFLWVVRSNFTQDEKGVAFPQGFKERVGKYGKTVEWAPQEKVLAHPSIACFFSHCGWNSTIEGVSRGVPYLCWPYFVDQMRNSYYICETWKVGLRVFPDEDGIVTRYQIKSKMDKLLSDQHIKANSLKLKDLASKSVSEGGVSFKNFMNFIEEIKD
ncbi:UDP-glycosyltransferase 83A1-like [Euphorbia lathyris]|uniref:UDP-glycosyltransferase 83A1-like n=1 Tax=Euphorbia lathyris TaxID=212925 RepID=UPI003313500B